MDESRWAVLTVPASRPYRNTAGMLVRPQLRVHCFEKGSEHQFRVVLDSGPLEIAVLRVKLDNHEPEDLNWYRLSDFKSYEYEESLAFLNKLLSARTLWIALEPFMVDAVIEARFDVNTLRREFERCRECAGFDELVAELVKKSQPREQSDVTKPKDVSAVFFLLTTTPAGAEAVFDGDTAHPCTTPCTVQIAPGVHTVAVKHPGYAKRSMKIDVPRQTSISIDLSDP
jgi:hypothetical protein